MVAYKKKRDETTFLKTINKKSCQNIIFMFHWQNE